MSQKRVTYFIVGILLILGVLLAACQEAEQVEVTREVEVTRIVEVPGEGETETVEVEVTRIVEVEAQPEMMVPAEVADLAIVEQWQNSPHNAAEDEAFVHWDEDDPAEVPTSCAKCHSTPGFIDFLGADGSEFGVVDEAAPIGSTIECNACHNDAARQLTTVTFPSGVTVTDLGDESRCMTCHQGRSSTVQVNASIEELGLTEALDETNEELGFINIHYYAAAATKYGTVAMGGYEYDGKSYDGVFAHVEPYDTCIECHDPHTLEVQVEECTACHEGVESAEDLAGIRTVASLVDYDGDGDMEEGIMAEIGTLQEMLNQAIQAYAAEVVEAPIVYSSASYPYFFADTNGNGEADEDEANYGNRYVSWTPRLLKAAYNYQVSKKDPGEYAHGGKYIIQLLYDSIEDLNTVIAEPVDLSNAHRIDHGHFAGSEEAFRHWDEDGAVPGRCSKCHSASGLPTFLAEGVTVSEPVSNGFQCTTCHASLETFELYETEQVEFPSGAILSFEDTASNMCLNCHQGRASGATVDAAIGDAPDGQVVEGLSFINVHYFAAGATLFGSEAGGVYEQAGQEYLGRFEHVGAFDTCIECHNAHALTVEVEGCANCHEVENVEDLRAIKMGDPVDFDGDGDAEEGIAGEIQTMEEMLLVAIQDYAAGNASTAAIVYDSHSYPYFFVDANENGEPDPDEANYGNRYGTWTPELLRAAYNYQYVQKDPGAFAHNGRYIIQVLYDALNAIGADVSGMVRPEVPAG